MHKLELYYRPTCPYCRKVLNFIEENSKKVELKNISEDPNALIKLKEIGGKQQVPCLFINDDPMYESDDIVNWLKQN